MKPIIFFPTEPEYTFCRPLASPVTSTGHTSLVAQVAHSILWYLVMEHSK